MDLSAWSHYWGECKDSYVLLRVPHKEQEASGCLIFDLFTSTTALIEDDELYRALVEKMRAVGVRELTREEVPQVVSPFEQVRQDVANKGISLDEANQRLRALKTDENSRREWLRQNEALLMT